MLQIFRQAPSRGVILQVCICLSLLLCFFVLPPFFSADGPSLPGGIPPTPLAGEQDQPEILRFHVRADSNSLPGQQVKNEVAAAILQRFAPAWHGCTSREELYRVLAEELEAMAETARTILREQGFDQDVAVLLGKSTFPARLYEGNYYPPGEYEALVVVIGAGRGENWWCVIFPPLCFNVLPAPANISATGEKNQHTEIQDEAVHDDGTLSCKGESKRGETGSGEKKWRFWLVEYFTVDR
ncbi:MAG: stage II sporulation protein R [Bacillota bacterium]